MHINGMIGLERVRKLNLPFRIDRLKIARVAQQASHWDVIS